MAEQAKLAGGLEGEDILERLGNTAGFRGTPSESADWDSDERGRGEQELDDSGLRLYRVDTGCFMLRRVRIKGRLTGDQIFVRLPQSSIKIVKIVNF